MASRRVWAKHPRPPTRGELRNSPGLTGPSVADWRSGYSVADSGNRYGAFRRLIRYRTDRCVADTEHRPAQGASALSLSLLSISRSRQHRYSRLYDDVWMTSR